MFFLSIFIFLVFSFSHSVSAIETSSHGAESLRSSSLPTHFQLEPPSGESSSGVKQVRCDSDSEFCLPSLMTLQL